jgi:inhibitor of KinA
VSQNPPSALPRFRAVADHALLVEFGEAISDAAHRAVLRLDGALARSPFPGFRESVPAYVNLLVEFDPLTADMASARAAVETLLATAPEALRQGSLREALVCYDEEFAPDIAVVADQTGLSPDAVIAAHLAGDYSVYMYGFAPGYAYLAGVPKILQLPRKPAPALGVEAGTVIIAGPQCLITTLTMPTGWWRIGRSPTRVLTGDPEQPFLFDVGDRVRFRRISRAEFEAAGA